jgi:hypothetical protein
MPQVKKTCACLPGGLVDRPVGGAPTDNDERAAVRAMLHWLIRYISRDRIHFGLAQVRHTLVVVRVVGDVTGVDVLLETAGAMYEAGHAGCDPRAAEAVRVSLPGQSLRRQVACLFRHAMALDRLEFGDVRYSSGFGGI